MSSRSPPENEFRFLLLGKTGCGKSTTGNTVLGEDLFDADVSFESVTSECTLKRSKIGNRTVEIMDSPGLFDTSMAHGEISALLMQALACMYPGPDAIFYVIKIGRYTEEEFGVYNRLKVLLDDSVKDYLIVLFSHGDALKGKKIEDMMKKAPADLRSVFKDCNKRHAVIDNVHRDSEQVESLLDKVEQLRKQNHNKPYQCPKYAYVGEKVEEEVNKRMADVEAKELESKKYVQELNETLQKTQDQATTLQEEFVEKEKEREAAIDAQSKETEEKMGELAEQLKAKQVSEEQQKQQMHELKTHLQETERQQKEEHERQREEQIQRLEKMHQQKEEFMKEMLKMKDEESRRSAEMYSNQLKELKDEISNQNAKDTSSSDCSIL